VVVTCCFRYSTFPVAGYYSTFPLLDVSTERHYLQFYSTFPLPVISITRRFSAPFVHVLPRILSAVAEFLVCSVNTVTPNYGITITELSVNFIAITVPRLGKTQNKLCVRHGFFEQKSDKMQAYFLT